ncbi:MAG TPA: phosphatase PAP2 family protein [Kineosporiaceae bacterium]
MPQLRPGWPVSLGTATALLAVFVACTVVGRRRPRPSLGVTAAFAREFTVIMLLLGLWQSVGVYVYGRVPGAIERGHRIAAWEAAWHLPSESGVQRALLGVPHLAQAADLFYAYAHLNGMALFIVWLWWRHREVYPHARFVIITSTLACLLVQVVPVAPPRLLSDLGFVDTALQDGSSVYGQFGAGAANQLAAMPSVHVGWAVIVGWYVFRSAPRRWSWIGPIHCLITVLVVVGTANHWWLDGFVAAGLVVLAVLGARALPGSRGRPGPSRPTPGRRRGGAAREHGGVSAVPEGADVGAVPEGADVGAVPESDVVPPAPAEPPVRAAVPGRRWTRAGRHPESDDCLPSTASPHRRRPARGGDPLPGRERPPPTAA